MSWTRGLLAALAVCVVLVTGSVSCGASGAKEHKEGTSVSPVGKVLDDTDQEGRHYREVDKDSAPEVGIEVQPATDDCWSVRLTVENFDFSPSNTKAEAVPGRGVAVLFVDDRPVTTLRTPDYRLAAAYVPQGTHKVTARLYADDGTVWAVDGDPVESTADVTASEPQPSTSTGGGTPGAESVPGAESTAGTGGDGSGAQSAPSAGEGASGARDGDSGARFAALTGVTGSGPTFTVTTGGGDSGTVYPATTGGGDSGTVYPATTGGGFGAVTSATTGAGSGTASTAFTGDTGSGAIPAAGGGPAVTPLTVSARDGDHGTWLTASTGGDR
ncbi:hypothetical protein [Streptomyces griseorubiginosus]|uniref:hypothetical protein n=1 Tax=Streptomyces griseorubiginosus TaxID=67304 RepID=UPI003AF382CF